MTPGPGLEDVRAYPVVIPMRHRFRGLTHREAIVLRGPAGWGEFSPFPEYPPAVAARWLAAALEAAREGFPAPRRQRVPVNVTVPASDPATARRIVEGSGCRTAKVKVAEKGQREAEDLARVHAVREALGVEGRVRVDANAAWDVPTAVERIGRLAEFDLEYVEQPVATLEEMRVLRREVAVPVAADELVRTLPDPVRIVEEGAADVLVLKVQPLGGVTAALEIAARAEVAVVISSALETSVGLAAGTAAAGALTQLPYACGLGTASLLAGDVARPGVVVDNGMVAVGRQDPDPDLLGRYRPDPAKAEEMVHRLREAANLLT
ncbi:MAG: o-succinylbenzoate synthase [Actinomycetota bacterium]